jgi:hypothetical protein
MHLRLVWGPLPELQIKARKSLTNRSLHTTQRQQTTSANLILSPFDPFKTISPSSVKQVTDIVKSQTLYHFKLSSL